jgi:hypothetical protein
VQESDLIIPETKSLLTDAPDGLIRASGFKICGLGIDSTHGTLTLLNNVTSDLLDVRARITCSNGPVQFLNAGGADFISTPLFNSNNNSYLEVNDGEGLLVSPGHIATGRIADVTNTTGIDFTDMSMQINGGTSGIEIFGDVTLQNTDTLTLDSISAIGGTGNTITIQGDLQVQGSITTIGFGSNIQAGGNVAASGTCCVSDKRVKQNITEVTPKSDLDTILSIPRRVKYKFTEAYQKVDGSVKDYVHDGFIAQEIKKYVPRAVSLVNRTVGSIHYPDFHQMHLEKIVPHLVGAVKQLHLEKKALEAKHHLLEASHEALLKEVHQMKEWMHTLIKKV